MSHGVAVNTRIAGTYQGDFRDDFTTSMSFPTLDLILLLQRLHLYISWTMAQTGCHPQNYQGRRYYWGGYRLHQDHV